MADVALDVVIRLRNELGAEIQKTRRDVKRSTGAMRSDFRSLGRSIRNAVLALGGFAAARAAFRGAAGGAVSFQRRMAEVSTLIDDASVNIDSLGDGLLRLGEEFGQTPEALSKGLYDAFSAGVINSANALDFMRDASRLAVAGVSDVATSVDILTSVLNSFERDASEAADVSDTLFRTVKVGKTTLPEIATSFGRFGAVANKVGLSLEQTGAAFAVLTKGGLSSEEAATALRAALNVLANASDDARKKADALGVSLSLSDLREDPVDFFRQLAQATQGSLEELAELIPNVRALTGVAILGSQDGRVFADAIDQMGLRAGSTDVAFAKMAATTGFAIDQLKGTARRVLIEIGSQFLPDIAKNAKSAGAQLSKFATENREKLVTLFREVGKAISQFLAQITKVIVAVAPLLDEFLEVIGIRINFLVARFSVFFTLIATAAKSGLKMSRGAQPLLERLGLEINESELENTIARVTEIQERLKELSLESGANIVGGGLRLIGNDEGAAQLRRALEAAGLIAKSTSKAAGATDDLGKKSKKNYGLVEDGAKKAKKEVAKLKDVTDLVAEAFKKPDLFTTIQALAKRRNEERAGRDPVDDFAEASNIIADMRSRIDLLKLPEGFKRDVQAVKINIMETVADVTNNFRIPAETLEDLLTIAKTLEELEIKELGRKVKQELSEVQTAIRNVGDQVATGLADILTDGFATGFDNVRDLARGLLLSLSNMFAKAAFLQVLKSAFPGIFPQGQQLGGIGAGSTAAMPLEKFALGGVFTGPTALATRNGVKVVGEGARDEAVVPLLSGQRIPVEFTGGQGGGLSVSLGGIMVSGGDFLNMSTDEQARIVGDAVRREMKRNPIMRQATAGAGRRTL